MTRTNKSTNNNTRLDNLEARMSNIESSLERILAALEPNEAPKPVKKTTGKGKATTPAKDKPKTKKANAPTKKAEPTLRLDKSEALELMITSWHNRAAAAYDRRKGGTGAVKYADFTATQKKAITADDKANGKTSLLASKKWKDAVSRHGIKESDLKW